MFDFRKTQKSDKTDIFLNITAQLVQQSTYHLKFEGSNPAIAKRSVHMSNKKLDFAIRYILNVTGHFLNCCLFQSVHLKRYLNLNATEVNLQKKMFS